MNTKQRVLGMSPAMAMPYGTHKITKHTKVTMPVCPSDWATNEFAPFGPEAKQRGREIQKYVKTKFGRVTTFFKRDGELYVTFNVNRIAHREVHWMKRCFFLDDRTHTFQDVGV